MGTPGDTPYHCTGVLELLVCLPQPTLAYLIIVLVLLSC